MFNRSIFLFIVFLNGCYFNGLSASFDLGNSNIAQRDTAIEIKKGRMLYKNGLNSFNTASKPEHTIKLLTAAKEIFEKYHVELASVVDIYYTLGLCYYLDLGKLDDALVELRTAKSLKEKLSVTLDKAYFKINIILGDVFLHRYQYDSAEYYYSYLFDNLSRFQHLTSKEYHGIYNSLGVLHYHAYEEYSLAIEYFQKSIQYGLEIFPAGSNEIIIAKNNLATSFARIGKFSEAIQKYRALLPYNKSVPDIYQNLAKAYQEVLAYDSSLIYLKKAELGVGTDNQLKIKIYNNMGITYTGLKDYSTALFYIEKAIALNETVYKSKNVALAFSYMNRGKIYEKQNKVIDALNEYQKALTVLHFNYNEQNIYHTPVQLTNLVSAPYFFMCLKYKAETFSIYYQKTSNTKDLQMSFLTYEIAIKLIENIRKNYSSQEAKLFFTSKVHSIYEGAIQTAYQLYSLTKQDRYKELAFSFSEKAKLAVLSDALIDLKLKQSSGLPANLLSQERNIKRRISTIFRKTTNATDSLKVASLKAELGDAEIELSKLIKEFDKHTPYYKLKYQHHEDHTNMLKSVLDKDEVLIEYFIGHNYLYTFTVSASGTTLDRFSVSNLFFETLTEWKTSLYFFEPGSLYHGQEVAHKLYNYLIKPIESVLSGKKKLIIIPDGALNYVPFEALVTNIKENNYLINDYTVRYGFPGILDFEKEKSTLTPCSVLSMAPFSGVSSDHFSQLKASGHEIASLKGKQYVGKAATKNEFLKNANAFDIIHLATHAKTFSEDPQQSYIAFYPDKRQKDSAYKLYMPEIYNLNFDRVKLIVISACEVGNGKFMKGEGIMGLSRAFAFAGCSNIVTSLWTADDEASAFIMADMHSYLEKGYDKDEALRQAKLAYLNSDVDQRMKSPVYWANFISIGDPKPLYPQYLIWYLMAGAVVVIIGVIIISKASLKEWEKRFREPYIF